MLHRYRLVGHDGGDERQSGSKSPECAELTARTAADEEEEEKSFLNEDEYLSTIYNRHVERFLYSHKLSESMLRARWPALPRSLPHARTSTLHACAGLDGDAELFQTLLLLPATDSFDDITVKDILGPALKTDAVGLSGMPYAEVGITERDANLSLLSYAFNLNPALRHQLSGEIATFQSEADLRRGGHAAIERTGVVKKGEIIHGRRAVVGGWSAP